MKTIIMTIKQFLAEREGFKCISGKCDCGLCQHAYLSKENLRRYRGADFYLFKQNQ